MLCHDSIFFSLTLMYSFVFILTVWVIKKIENNIWKDSRQVQHLLEVIGCIKMLVYGSIVTTILIITAELIVKIFYKK